MVSINSKMRLALLFIVFDSHKTNKKHYLVSFLITVFVNSPFLQNHRSKKKKKSITKYISFELSLNDNQS